MSAAAARVAAPTDGVRSSTAWSDAAFGTFLPRPRLSVSEWADRYRVIAQGTSPEPGAWRTSRVPYLREPMDAISDPMVERVVMMCGSQLAKSELLLNAIGYFAHQDPAPMLFVQPTEEASLAFMKERIEKTFEESPALRGLLSDGLRDPKNTLRSKMFPGGHLATAWATSPVALASRPIRVVLLDEVDRYPGEISGEGDPVKLAIQRTANFHNRKIVAVSTPTVDGESRIQQLYEDSDQRRLWVPCLCCGVFQVLAWSNIQYKGADGKDNLADIHYRCSHCRGRIEERDKAEMLAAGEWRPDVCDCHHTRDQHAASGAGTCSVDGCGCELFTAWQGATTRGYQISALYSPFVRWSELANEWIKANRERDRKGLREFLNLKLGEPWTESGEQVNADALDLRREEYEAELPASVLVLTVGVDVQDNRLELEVAGWGKGKESWGIHYAIIPGDTSDVSSANSPWRKLDALLDRPWKRADGATLKPWCVAVDSGGHRTDEVYEFCRARLARNIFAIKGRSGPGLPTVGKPTLNKIRAPLYLVGVDGAKDVLVSRLAIDKPGPGFCHFPNERATGYDTEYFAGLTSERKQHKHRAGRRITVWKQIRDRNEPLDCRVYATAALEIGLSTNQGLLEQLAAAASGPVPAKSQPVARTPQRRVFSRGVQV